MDSDLLSGLVGKSLSAILKSSNPAGRLQELEKMASEEPKPSGGTKRAQKAHSSNKKIRKLNAEQQQMAVVQWDLQKDLIMGFCAKNQLTLDQLSKLAEKARLEESKIANISDQEMEEANPPAGPSNNRQQATAPKPTGASSKMVKTNKDNEKVPSEAPKTVKKMPAIITGRINPGIFQRNLEESTKVNYKLKKGMKTALYCESVEGHGEVMKLLKSEDAGGFSYTPNELKKKVLVMKNIHESISVKEIKDSLKEQTGIEVEVKRLTTPRSINQNYTLDIVLVMTMDEKYKQLFKVCSIQNILIKWEHLKKKGPIQCRNCQSFGHVAKWCLYKYQCVKCKEPHGPKECKRDKKSKKPPFCINCGEEGHPASFGGCPVVVELRQKVEENRVKKQETKNQLALKRQMIDASLNTLVTPGVTFSAVTKAKMTNKGAQKEAPTKTEGSIGFIGAECKRLFNTDLFPLLEKSREFVPKYKQLKSDDAKQMALMDFMSKL